MKYIIISTTRQLL